MSDWLTGGLLVAFGALEGYAFAGCGVVSPSAMKGQMSFSSMAVLKMFTAAVGASMLTQSAMELSGSPRFEQTRHYSHKGLDTTIVVIGSALLGVGMYLSGSGPSMMPSQLAVGVSTAPYILAGAFVGALFHAVFERRLPSNSGPIQRSLDATSKSYAAYAVPLGLGLLAFSYYFLGASTEYFFNSPYGTITPTTAGIILGFNQLPLRALAGRGQGGSTPVLSLLSTATAGQIAPQHRITSVRSAFQTLYVYVGTFIGALLCIRHMNMAVINHSLGEIGYTPMDAFVGGFLMLFGARLAGGCTCGHGITGVSELSPVSIVATAAMFAGGVGAAMLNLSVPRYYF